MQVDPREQLLYVEIGLDAMCDEAVDKPYRRPPERLGSLRRRDAFDGNQRFAHPYQPLFGTGVAQKSQQATLEQGTCNLDFCRQGFLGEAVGVVLAACAHAQVREEQFTLKYALGTLQFAQLFIERKQRKLAAAAPIRQILDPALQAGEGVAQGTQHGVIRQQAVLVHVDEAILDGTGQCGGPFEAHHAQGARHLMRVVARQTQGVGQVGVDAVGLDAAQCGLQGGIDVAAYPVEGAGVVVE